MEFRSNCKSSWTVLLVIHRYITLHVRLHEFTGVSWRKSVWQKSTMAGCRGGESHHFHIRISHSKKLNHIGQYIYESEHQQSLTVLPPQSCGTHKMFPAGYILWDINSIIKQILWPYWGNPFTVNPLIKPLQCGHLQWLSCRCSPQSSQHPQADCWAVCLSLPQSVSVYHKSLKFELPCHSCTFPHRCELGITVSPSG